MTLEEKRKLCGDYCDGNDSCSECIFNDDSDAWCGEYSRWTAPEILIEYAVNKIQELQRKEEIKEVFSVANTKKVENLMQQLTEMVNHPSHYNQGGMECIDEMIMVFGKSAVMNFCLCNAWKYRYRANAKNGQEDLDKANWYLAKYKELKESEV